MPNSKTRIVSGGVGRLIFTNKVASTSIDNHHIVNGPSPRDAAARRAILRRASNNSKGQPCCITHQSK